MNKSQNDVISNSFLENPALISNVLFNNQPNQSIQFMYPNDNQNLNLNSNKNFNNQKKNTIYNFNNNQSNNFNINQSSILNYNFNSLNQNNQKFNWKEIMKINPNDSNSFEPYLNNLLNSSLNPNEIELLPENNIIQLVNLLQNVIKISINNNNNLIEQNNNLNKLLNSSIQFQNENNLNNNLENEDDEYNNLKKINQKQEKLIQSYQQVLDGKKKYNSQLIESDDDENEKNDSYNNTNKNRFYCQFCANKKFYTEQYLEDHMRRRHLNYYQKFISKINKQPDYNSKLNEMKTYFENMITNNQLRNDYYRLNDKLNGLESLINSQNKEIMIPNNQSYIPNNETIVYKSGKRNNIIYEDDSDLISKDDEKTIIYKMNEIQKNLDKNRKNFQDTYNDMIDHMKQFQSKVKKELSVIKQMQSSIRGKELMNSINLNNDSQYIAPQRREFRTSTLKNSQIDRNQLLNSIRNSEQKNLNNSEYKISNIYQINNKTIIKNESNIPDNLDSIKISESIKLDNTNVDNNKILKGGNKQNENYNIFKSNIIDGDIENQTEYEKELQIFYNNYITRDKNINNQINSFLGRTIPKNFSLNENNIKNTIDHFISDKIYEASNSNANNESNLNLIKNENLFEIIDKLYSEIGDECADNDVYGLHNRLINGLLNIDEIIDNAHNEYYGFKEKKKKIQRNFIEPNNFTETIQYDIQSSNKNDSFSFNKQ